MSNKPKGPGSIRTTELSFWRADTAKGEIETIKGELFAGHKINWIKLWDIGFHRLLQACLSSDYAKFIENELEEFKNLQKKAGTLSNQAPTAATDTTIPEVSKETVATNAATPVLGSPQEPEAQTNQAPIAVPDNLTLETTSENNEPSESIEIAATQVTETPDNAPLIDIKARINKNSHDLAGLTKIKKELDNLDPEIKANSLFKEIKAYLESTIIEAERHFLDKRLTGQFTTGKMNKDFVNEAIAGVRKDFSGTIGEYRIKVISAIVTKLLDAAKDSSEALGDLKKMVADLKIKMAYDYINVGDEEEDLDLLDPKQDAKILVEDQTLVGLIDKLSKDIESAQAEAKAKEADVAKPALIAIGEKISTNSDLSALTNIRKELNDMVASNPEIKTQPHFDEIKGQLETSLKKAINAFIIEIRKKTIASSLDLTELTNIKKNFNDMVKSYPEIGTHYRFEETKKLINDNIENMNYFQTGERKTEEK